MFDVQSHRGAYSVHFADALGALRDRGSAVLVGDRKVVVDLLGCTLDAERDILFDAGEATKTLSASERLLKHLLGVGFKRGQRILCIGGGTIQDLVSFTASILYRGVQWDFIPTTLLAQCDSCIGSKTSINFNGFKNILGGFHPPQNVIIDTSLLAYLSPSEIRSGIGEMLHYFILYHEFSLAKELVEAKSVTDLGPYIQASLSLKKQMIEKDEFDKGERNLFNYGHTFGHAIEVESDYAVNHGQAVTMGMRIANKLSLKHGLIDQSLYDLSESILHKNMPDYKIQSEQRFLDALRRDKKNTDGRLTCILLTQDYGVKMQVEYNEVLEVL